MTNIVDLTARLVAAISTAYPTNDDLPTELHAANEAAKTWLSENDANDARDEMWVRGERAALTGVLEHCVRRLGYETDEVAKAAWISEREGTVAMLRMVCDIHGDNDWSNDMHLSDVVEKHLGHHLDAAETEEDKT